MIKKIVIIFLIISSCCIGLEEDNVPYMGQRTNLDCDSAASAMLFAYFIEDMTYERFIWETGRGQIFGYSGRYALMGTHLPEILQQVASWYGLIYAVDYCAEFDGYLKKVKEHISAGFPVITSVDPFHIPQFEKMYDADKEKHGGHAIVITGSDTKGIFFNDPQAALFNQNGKELHMTYEELKEVISNTTGPRYILATLSGDLSERPAIKFLQEENRARFVGKSKIFKNYYGIKFGIRGMNRLHDDLDPENFKMLYNFMGRGGVIQSFQQSIMVLNMLKLYSSMDADYAREMGIDEIFFVELHDCFTDLSFCFEELIVLLQEGNPEINRALEDAQSVVKRILHLAQ